LRCGKATANKPNQNPLKLMILMNLMVNTISKQIGLTIKKHPL
jgi:hypothetical protein